MVFGFLKHHLAGMMHRKPVGNLGLGAGASKRRDGEDGSTSALLPVFQIAFTTIFLSRYPITRIVYYGLGAFVITFDPAQGFAYCFLTGLAMQMHPQLDNLLDTIMQYANVSVIRLLPMERQQELLSTEIVNRGVKNSGPYAGSLNFSVRVLRGFPDFLNSANLKYVEPGYSYLLSPMFYFLTAPVLIVILSAQIGKLFIWQDFCLKRDPIDALILI
ncbi:hypothetical protein NC652_040330 [Populus alba x Populus x berolinensis]|nr:hypothetical protein NC652_040330 [Populus alba x Populus x berolinensis]